MGFDRDGAPDPRLGSQGVLTASIDSLSLGIYAVQVQPDPKVVLVGNVDMDDSDPGYDNDDNDLVLWRFFAGAGAEEMRIFLPVVVR